MKMKGRVHWIPPEGSLEPAACAVMRRSLARCGRWPRAGLYLRFTFLCPPNRECGGHSNPMLQIVLVRDGRQMARGHTADTGKVGH